MNFNLKSNNSLTIIILLIINTIIYCRSFDSLSYYEKFNIATESYKQGRYALSEKQFKNILINDRDYFDPAAQLMMAKSQYQMANYNEAKRASKAILSNFDQSPYDVDVLILLGDIALSQGKTTMAFTYYIKARKKNKKDVYTKILDNRIHNSIGIGIDETIVEGLLFKEENNNNRSIINIARGYQEWINGNYLNLELILENIDLIALPEFYLEFYHSLKSDNSQFVKQVTIAVMLPLSGKEKDKGLAYLAGISEYMKTVFESTAIRFLIYDTEGSPIIVLENINKILSNTSVKALLGPITKDEILSLSGLKSDLPILIPKSYFSGLSEIAENLFFLSPSRNIIARRTAQIIIKEFQLNNIAVLSPGNGKEKIFTDYFLDECYQLGVDPIIVEWYIEKPENISRQLKNIRKKAWGLLEKGKEEKLDFNLKIDSLDALFDVDVSDFFALPPTEEDEMSKDDSNKVILETIEALFIPIRKEELTYIGRQLPFYNLNTTLFGNENWLEMPLLNQEVIGPHVSGMKILSDVNSALSINNHDLFLNYFTLAGEHVRFIQTIIKEGIIKRRQILNQLKNNNGYYGENTSLIFSGKNNNENGSVQVLEYEHKRLKKIGIYDGESMIETKNE